jgi:hypothetical protein
MPGDGLVAKARHGGASIRSYRRSFDVTHACTSVGGAAHDRERLDVAHEALAAAAIFRKLRRVSDNIQTSLFLRLQGSSIVLAKQTIASAF